MLSRPGDPQCHSGLHGHWAAVHAVRDGPVRVGGVRGAVTVPHCVQGVGGLAGRGVGRPAAWHTKDVRCPGRGRPGPGLPPRRGRLGRRRVWGRGDADPGHRIQAGGAVGARRRSRDPGLPGGGRGRAPPASPRASILPPPDAAVCCRLHFYGFGGSGCFSLCRRRSIEGAIRGWQRGRDHPTRPRRPAAW